MSFQSMQNLNMLYDILQQEDNTINSDKFNNCLRNFKPLSSLKESNKAFVTMYLNNINNIVMGINSQEYKSNRTSEFENNMEKHKQNFDKLNIVKRPPEISFADTIQVGNKINDNDINDYIQNRDNINLTIDKKSTTIKNNFEIDEEFNNLHNKLNKITIELQELKSLFEKNSDDIISLNNKFDFMKK
jgi:DNA repair ATPase RecN